jgi:AcrR family transcriptional regulator
MATLSRRERTDATRQATEAALMRATIALLGEDTPFAELGIEQIVKRAGFSRPTFYSYFRDKRELILRLGEQLQESAAAAADPWLTAATSVTRQTLEDVLGALRAHRETLIAIIEAATYDPEVDAFWRAFHDRFWRIATERIADGVPDLDGEHVAARAYALVLMTVNVFAAHLTHPLRDEDALLDELAELWERSSTA